MKQGEFGDIVEAAGLATILAEAGLAWHRSASQRGRLEEQSLAALVAVAAPTIGVLVHGGRKKVPDWVLFARLMAGMAAGSRAALALGGSQSVGGVAR